MNRPRQTPLAMLLPSAFLLAACSGGGNTDAELVASARVHIQKAEHAAAVMPRQLLAHTYNRTGQPGKALQVLKPIVGDPNADAGSLTLAGEALLQIGDMARAEATFARAAKVDPKATTARAVVALGQLARGIAAGGFEVMNVLSTAQMAAGQGQQAINTFSKLAALRPDWPEPGVKLAEAHAAANDLAAARRSLNKALQTRPGWVPAQRALAIKLHANLGNAKRDAEASRLAKLGDKFGAQDEVAKLLVTL